MSDTPEITIAELELQAEVWKVEALAEDAENNLISRLASRWEARVYYFDGPVNFKSISDCISTLDDWRRLDRNKKEKRMHIIFNGTAGIIGANAMHDYIRWLRLDGFEITFEVAGRAAGQSAIIGTAATHFHMTASSWIQLSEVSLFAEGNTFHAGNEIEFNNRLEAQMHARLSERSQGRLTARQIASRIRRKIWMVSGTDAKDKFGLTDDVSTVRPEHLTRPAGFWFKNPIPKANNMKERLSAAATRKMRAEAWKFELENDDRRCNALNNGVVRFIDTVTTEAVNKAKVDLDSALRLTDSDLTLLIYSNGGSCTDGLGFINLCDQIRNSPRTINTEGIGYCASMGGVMLQCGKKRTMGKNAWLLIHRVGSWFGDTTTMAKDEKAYCDALEKQCFGILAERSIFKNAEEIRARCRTNDWWLTAEEALAYGFIDEIR